jgi:hypothetical protein
LTANRPKLLDVCARGLVAAIDSPDEEALLPLDQVGRLVCPARPVKAASAPP